MRTTFLSALAGLVCFWPVTASAQSQRATYRCKGGLSVKVRFLDDATAMVSLRGRSYRVKNTRAASGSRYSGQGLTFWEHQGEASIEHGGQALLCAAVS